MKTLLETKDFPFFKLSHDQDLILFLIKKELQGTKFAKELDRIGFDQSTFCPDLGVVIMSLVGFKERSDTLWEWYMEVMDAFADQVDLWDSRTAHELALDFYIELRAKLKSN